MKRPLSFISALAVCAAMFAAVDDLPLVDRNGTLCHFYEVQPKETIYSLSHKLGLTADEIIAANPQVADGLRAHEVLYFPVKASETQPRTVTHKVAKGETIYGLSKIYGISPDELIAQNPSLRDGGLRAGQTVTVTYPATVSPAQLPGEGGTAPEAAPGTHIVKDGETFYSIAHAHGLTVSQLEGANHSVGVLHPGDVLTIPQIEPEPLADLQPSPIPDEEPTPEVAVTEPSAEPAPQPVVTPVSKRPAVAVMLPFMLSQQKLEKSATRFTEFFKGFLLAADSLRNEGNPVDIYAFDTAGSLDSVRSILARPELAKVSMIIAPDNDAQLEEIGEWGRKNGVLVLNTFVVRDKSHLSNPVVMQANLPHDRMYDRAIDGLLARYPDHRVVIVSRADGPTDHKEFIDELHLRLDNSGNPPLELSFSGELSAADLSTLPANTPLVFIPVSGKQAELSKIMPALIEMKNAAASPDDVLLFGYPEWITYRGKTLEDMTALNTTVYSRFYNDAESLDSKDVEESFNRWYGTRMESAVPRQGLLGFDTGMMVIRALRHNGGDFSSYSPVYRGVQNGYNFRRASSDDDAGWINDVLFLINFRPGGMIDRSML